MSKLTDRLEQTGHTGIKQLQQLYQQQCTKLQADALGEEEYERKLQILNTNYVEMKSKFLRELAVFKKQIQYSMMALDTNNINNYVVPSKCVNKQWLSNNHLNNSSPEELIKLNCIKELFCPFCQYWLQCIRIKQNTIVFLCINFPKCRYPLGLSDYANNYVMSHAQFLKQN